MAAAINRSAIQESLLGKFVRWCIVILFAVLPILYFPGRVGAYITSKQYFFIGTMELVLACWAWLLLTDKRYRIPLQSFVPLTPFFIFLLSLTISAFTGADTATSFFSTVESGTGLIVLYHVFLFTCVLVSLTRMFNWKFIRSILQANLFASVALAIFTYLTPFGIRMFRISSLMLDGSSGGAMMGNSLLAAAYLIFALFMTPILIYKTKSVFKKTLYTAGMVLIIFSPVFINLHVFSHYNQSIGMVSFLGQARMAAVAIVFGAILSVILWLALQRKKWLRRVGFFLAGIGVIGSVCIAKELFTSGTKINTVFVTQSGNRIVDWQASISGFEEKPFFGWGPENFRLVYQKYLNPVVFDPGRGNEVWATHPHNYTLEMLVCGGMFGLLFYSLILAEFIVVLVHLYRKKRIDAKTLALLSGMLVAFILQQQLIYESIVSYVLFYSVFAVLVGMNADPVQYTFRLGGKPTVRTYVLGAMVIVIIGFAWIWSAYLPARKVEELQQTGDAKSDMRSARYQHLFHSSGSYAIATDVEFYTDPLFFSYDAQKETIKENPVFRNIASQELTSLLASVDPIWQKHQQNYHLALSLLQIENTLFYFTEDSSRLVNAENYAQHAIQLSPNDPQVYTAYAQTLVYEHNTQEAKEMLDKALRLNVHYEPAVDFRKMLK